MFCFVFFSLKEPFKQSLLYDLLISFSRKWKEIVDEWVRVNQPGELESAALMGKIII